MERDGSPTLVNKALVIGVFGLPGSGKSTVLNALTRSLPENTFQFYEGSTQINSLVPGGLSVFQDMEDEAKTRWWEQAIRDIQLRCVDRSRTAIVTGHCMFWPQDTPEPQIVTTKADLETFTHVIYLRTAPETIATRIVQDSNRSRSTYSEEHLRIWQDAEISTLQTQCYGHGILFYEATANTSVEKMSTLINDFHHHDEAHNGRRAQERLDAIMNTQPTV